MEKEVPRAPWQAGALTGVGQLETLQGGQGSLLRKGEMEAGA